MTALPPPAAAARGDAVWPTLIVLVAMASYQLGASVAKQLFPLIGAQGATAMRLTLSAIILGALVRPWRGGIDRRALPPLLLYGLALGALNTFFYVAVQTIPLGIAVAINFLGPLSVAIVYSRRGVDLVWAALAGCGILLLLPVGPRAAALDGKGLAFCGMAALTWAIYIVAGSRAGARLGSGRAAAIGVAIGAVLILPFGVAQAGSALVSWAVLPLALLVAVLSSALPNSLEMVALTRLPTRVFGVLMSLEPALGALFGWLVLGEHLTGRQELAIALVVLASAGSTLTASRALPATGN